MGRIIEALRDQPQHDLDGPLRSALEQRVNPVGRGMKPAVPVQRRADSILAPWPQICRIKGNFEGKGRLAIGLEPDRGDYPCRRSGARNILDHRLEGQARRQRDPFPNEGLAAQRLGISRPRAGKDKRNAPQEHPDQNSASSNVRPETPWAHHRTDIRFLAARIKAKITCCSKVLLAGHIPCLAG